MEEKHCKWYNDEFCTNGDSPCVADYCPVVEYPELCKHREVVKDINVCSKTEEKKLTDEQIVKALYCLKGQYISYIDDYDDKCKLLFVDDILDLIHRLQDENERLMERVFDCTAVIEYNEKCSKEIQAATILLEQRNKEIAEKNTEIERLTDKKMQETINKICNARKNQYANMKLEKLEKLELISIEEHKKQLVETRKETAEKFAEMVSKAFIGLNCIDIDEWNWCQRKIDEICKEIVEGKDGNYKQDCRLDSK